MPQVALVRSYVDINVFFFCFEMLIVLGIAFSFTATLYGSLVHWKSSKDIQDPQG